ncbi:putative amidohydrolase YtcJ [Alkalibacillus flavidus]|uniref:Amidohydrolase YtcJ n=1 Tax=Alkalibacillus flavidus TaxID=546021 RepID=A0ABV2KST9_9BACI
MGNLWTADTIYTMIDEGHTVEAIYEEEGVIVDTGDYDSLKSQYNDRIEHENYTPGTMLPGFIDSHLHIIGHGERLLRLDVTYETSRQALLKAVEDASKQLDPNEWLIAEGFNENNWDEPVVIHRRELDEIATDNPIILTRVCRHAMVANSKAMALAGIDHDTDEPDGGVIERDEHGDLTGFFLDQGQELLKQTMPEPDQAYLEKAITKSIDDLLSNGIVSGHSEDLSYYGGYQKTADAFRYTVGRDQRFRAHLLVHHEVVDDYINEQGVHGVQDDWLEFGAMKLFADGALGGRTALLSQPYADDPSTHGVAIHTNDELESLVKKARSYDMTVAIHAIGDLAAENVLNVLEKHPPKRGAKDRLIHGQIMRYDLIKRMQVMPISIDIQPTFVSSDFPWANDRVSADLIKTSYPWRSYLEAGILCGGSSDAPIEEVNPLNGIAAAIDRRSQFDGQTYQTEQCLSVYDAVKLYTHYPAQIVGKGERQGIIQSEAVADFVVLSDDILQCSAEAIRSVNVTHTIVGGRVVYRK